MELKNNELEKKDVIINRVRLETQSEELLEQRLEDMNKQLIIYIPLMILCMLKIKELKKILKEQVLFFVLQLLEIVPSADRIIKTLNINLLKHISPEFQFSVSSVGFSVLVPAPGKFNSLYRASSSLKIKK